MIAPRRFAVLVSASSAAGALVWDPRAEAADPKRAFGLVLAVVAFSAWTARSARTHTIAWGPRCGALFVGLSAVSLLWGLPGGARDLGTMCVAVGAAAIAAQLGPRYARRIARFLALVIGTISGAVAIAQAARGTTGMLLHAGQGNPNWLGLLVAIALPLSIDLVLASRKKLLVGLATAFQLPALYLSHSRVGWIAAVVACVAVGLLAVHHPARRRAVAIVSALAIAFAAQVVRDIDGVPPAIALAGRAWIWRQTAHAAGSVLPFGAGLGQFGHTYLDAQGRELLHMTPSEAARHFVNATTAHDDYLQAALESGPLAALLLAAALLIGARDHVRAQWSGGAAALLACAICAVGDSPLRQPAVALVAGFVLGVPVVGAARRLRARVPLAFALALVAWLLFDATRVWLATRERTLALEADPRTREVHLARSARLDPGSGEALLELGLTRLGRGDPKGALDALNHAEGFLADTGLRIAIGSAHLALGDASSAAAAYERALAWDSGSFRAHAGLAEALLAQGRLDAAELHAETARRLLPGDPRAREILDRIHEAHMDD